MEIKYISIANAKKGSFTNEGTCNLKKKILTKLYSVQITVCKVHYKDPHFSLLRASQIHSQSSFQSVFKLPIWTLPRTAILLLFRLNSLPYLCLLHSCFSLSFTEPKCSCHSRGNKLQGNTKRPRLQSNEIRGRAVHTGSLMLKVN